ncbi:MAG: nucleotidyltransferase domain-containing protein [Candidatus Omnitrophota bacterium]
MNKNPEDNNIKKYIEPAKDVLADFKKIDYAFVFGSSLKKALPESDMDILIGGTLSFSEKADLAAELELILKRKVDLVLAEEAAPALVAKAFSTGLPLLINNKESLKKDYFKNLYRYDDGRNLRNLRIARIKRRYGYG